MTEENVIEAVTQAERKLVSLYAALKGNAEIADILEKKEFATIEGKQAATAAVKPAKRVARLEDPEALDLSDREQREEMTQQLNERTKLKHEALNRYERKQKLKAKKPRTAAGQRRGFFN